MNRRPPAPPRLTLRYLRCSACGQPTRNRGRLRPDHTNPAVTINHQVTQPAIDLNTDTLRSHRGVRGSHAVTARPPPAHNGRDVRWCCGEAFGFGADTSG